MKRKKSVILFGLSFLIALLGEIYLLNMIKIDILSVVGIGIVVILTGYLWMDSLLDFLSNNEQKNNILLDENQKVNDEKENSRHIELLNLLKATYTALKKSDIKLQEEIDEIKQIQQKAMDGQRKALNISVNYSREHTKELIKAIKSECEGINYEEQLLAIISLLDNNGETTETSKDKGMEVKPLYDDPNKVLTTDEISELFNNYGK